MRSTYVGEMSQFVAQTPRMDEILMGYYMANQVRTRRSSVIYNNKFIMGYMTLRRIIIIPCEMFLEDSIEENLEHCSALQ